MQSWGKQTTLSSLLGKVLAGVVTEIFWLWGNETPTQTTGAT